MKRLIFIISIFCFLATLNGQDLHLSNYQPAGMLFNPSLTGASGADMQFGVQYRKQWAAITEGYTTMGGVAELRTNNVGLGFQIHQNHGGETSLKTTGVMLSGAYHKPLAEHSHLSLGVALGRLQKQFNPSSYTYDNQYVEGDGFNAALPSGESFNNTDISITDLAVGLHWNGLLTNNGKLKGHVGLAFAHLHTPDEGFSESTEVLPMKTVVQAGVDIRVGSQFDLSPNIFYQKQGEHQAVTGGVSIGGKLDEHSKIIFGMAYRLEDAVIGQVGLEHKNKKIYLSYDANSSQLKSATAGNGALELGLYITFDSKHKKEPKDTDGDGVFDHKDKCPTVPGLVALKGCPDEKIKEKVAIDSNDADGDGVPDELDRCPLEPGLPYFHGCNDKDRDGTIDPDDSCPEIFGPLDNNGCPKVGRDADKDGIPDEEDYCVYLKGLREFHGCPDSDRDGISDVDDHCPYLKGTLANDGCPSGMGGVAPRGAAVIIEFDSDRAELKPEFQLMLDNFAQGIPTGSNYKVMISGHTDAEGNDQYNYTLSQLRADEVAAYLMRKGYPANRFQTISYGEAIPRRSNETHFGKARNRRCEVTLILE